jgi:hypothetical protein
MRKNNTNINQSGYILPLIGITILLIVVACGAYFWGKNQQKTTLPKAPVATTATPMPDLTTGWKTYTNSTYRYVIKYPPSWEVDNDQSRPEYFVVTDPTTKVESPHQAGLITSGNSIIISVQNVADNYTYQTLLDDNNPILHPDEPVSPITFSKDITIDGISGKQSEDEEGFDGGSIRRYIIHNGLLFTFIQKYHLFSLTEGRQQFPNSEKTFDQVISTFKFTDNGAL